MRSVELRVSADELSHVMDRMRIWLDNNSVIAKSFRYDRDADGTVVNILTFDDDADADAFANAFNGRPL
jgi:hypothetical protein